MLSAGRVRRWLVLAADAAPNPWFDPSYVVDNWDTILGYLGEHVRLTVLAVVLGALIALPLAAAGAAQPVPGRAGAGPVDGRLHDPVAGDVRLHLPVHRAVVDHGAGRAGGLLAGHPGAQLPRRPAGRAGRRPGGRRAAWATARLRLFWQVDLPLALPTFMAGLRIATVSTVALVDGRRARRARRPRAS